MEGEGVSAREGMVCGDDFNDLGLFRLCGFPVAMDHAIPDRKAQAAYITASNDHDGGREP